MNEYMDYLYKQYCAMLGKKINLKEYNADYNDFSKWVNNRQLIGLNYKMFLQDMGVKFQEERIAEANKGIYDTISDTSMDVYSPFAFTMNLENRRIREDYTNVILYSLKEQIVLTPNKIDTIITQNPYSNEYIHAFDKIHYNGINICIGMFGNLNDKDKDQKINLLKSIKQELRDTEINIVSDNDKYYGAVVSSNIVRGRK